MPKNSDSDFKELLADLNILFRYFFSIMTSKRSR